MKKHSYIYICIFLSAFLPFQSLLGYNLRQISGNEGLSNSAILSMCQDSKGYMWFGSVDGLNMFDGINVHIYKSADAKRNLSGNLIEKVFETEENIFWVHTNYGLDRIDKQRDEVENFVEFSGAYFICKSGNNEVFIVKEDNVIHYYNQRKNAFEKIQLPGLVYNDVLNIFVDKNDILWIFTNSGQNLGFIIIRAQDGSLQIDKKKTLDHSVRQIGCYDDGNSIYIVDEQHVLFEYNTIQNKKYYIQDLSSVVKERGTISSITKHSNDYFIGFQTNGLICLRNTPDKKESYRIEDMNIQAGIFCLYKDKFQNILWIGTDGQGVYMYSEDAYSIRSTMFSNFTYRVEKPVRAIYLDNQNTLWLGTKGDGIVRIHDYHPNKGIKESNVDYLNEANGQLDDNSVYAFGHSKKNILWIGNDNGINYYSYSTRNVRKMSIEVDNKKIKYIHSIAEVGDALWIATVGMGIYKADIVWNGDTPSLVNIKHSLYSDASFSSNYFFTIYQDDRSSTLWFGNRGHGVFPVNNIEDELKPIQFGKRTNKQILNDIFSILRDGNNTIWAGTGSGLVKYTESGDERVFDENSGFPNSAIHSMLMGNGNNLWLSTNRGIVKFDILNETYQSFDHHSSLKVIEFSDGAFFKDKKTGVLYFGGINGFVTISENNVAPKEYLPPIQFSKLSIFGNEQNILDFLKPEDGVLELNFNQNFFSIGFAAIDYINGNNYTYYYKLDELSDDQWIDTGLANQASFTNLSPGKYQLDVKYRNRVTGEDSSIYSIVVRIRPPWYMSVWAYMLYIAIILFTAGWLIRKAVERNKKKKRALLDSLEQSHREEVYESKLRFFTNIAHEFCTPLTLIYGPCNRILEHNGSDNFVKKYTHLIQRNAERLNSLIQELIEFRRIETGNRTPFIEEVAISSLATYEVEPFDDIAESRYITFEKSIQSHLSWNLDKGFFKIIISNLLSNAFKYTTDKGHIRLKIENRNEELLIKISNTGKGIKEENIARIFDRYSILDNLENQQKNFSRNGLGLAISNNMIKLMNGEIEVKSVPDEWTDFIVRIPRAEINVLQQENIKPLLSVHMPEKEIAIETPKYEFDKFKQTILIIDDEPEMLWFVSEMFAAEYNVIALNNPSEADKVLEELHPNIILCDIAMPLIDGITLAKKIKNNPKVAHIPLILISAKHEIEEQIEGLAAGAELYITKPFNVEYLKISVKHLINRKETLKDYFSSPLSAYELTDSKLTHKEHKKFVKDIYDIIYKNLINKKLTTKLIASEMNISIRHLYRKLDEMNEQSPSDMIRECRLHVAKDLLLNSKLTIDEIIYKSGFSVRSTFFKVFADKYGCTPKEFRDKNTTQF